jgi:hypothetical protein
LRKDRNPVPHPDAGDDAASPRERQELFLKGQSDLTIYAELGKERFSPASDIGNPEADLSKLGRVLAQVSLLRPGAAEKLSGALLDRLTYLALILDHRLDEGGVALPLGFLA